MFSELIADEQLQLLYEQVLAATATAFLVLEVSFKMTIYRSSFLVWGSFLEAGRNRLDRDRMSRIFRITCLTENH